MKREDVLQILEEELEVSIDISEDQIQFTDSKRIEITIKIALGNKIITTSRDYFRIAGQ